MDRRYRPCGCCTLAPLEALGWWAGWYGEQVDNTLQKGSRKSITKKAARYVVYLDGIGQSTFEYLQIF